LVVGTNHSIMGEVKAIVANPKSWDGVTLALQETDTMADIRAKVLQEAGYKPQDERQLQISFASEDSMPVLKCRDVVDKNCSVGVFGLWLPTYTMCSLLNASVEDSSWFHRWSTQFAHAKGVVVFRSDTYIDKIRLGQEQTDGEKRPPLWREAQAVMFRRVIDKSFQAYVLNPNALLNGPHDLYYFLSTNEKEMNIDGWEKELKTFGCEITPETVSQTLAVHIRENIEGILQNCDRFLHIASFLKNEVHPPDALLLLATATNFKETQVSEEKLAEAPLDADLEKATNDMENALSATTQANQQEAQAKEALAKAVQAFEADKESASTQEAKTQADQVSTTASQDAEAKRQTYKISQQATKKATDAKQQFAEKSKVVDLDKIRKLCCDCMRPHFSKLHFEDFPLVKDHELILDLFGDNTLCATEDKVFDAIKMYVEGNSGGQADPSRLTATQKSESWEACRWSFVSAKKGKIAAKTDHIPQKWMQLGFVRSKCETDDDFRDLLSEVEQEFGKDKVKLFWPRAWQEEQFGKKDAVEDLAVFKLKAQIADANERATAYETEAGDLRNERDQRLSIERSQVGDVITQSQLESASQHSEPGEPSSQSKNKKKTKKKNQQEEEE